MADTHDNKHLVCKCGLRAQEKRRQNQQQKIVSSKTLSPSLTPQVPILSSPSSPQEPIRSSPENIDYNQVDLKKTFIPLSRSSWKSSWKDLLFSSQMRRRMRYINNDFLYTVQYIGN